MILSALPGSVLAVPAICGTPVDDVTWSYRSATSTLVTAIKPSPVDVKLQSSYAFP
jgi:hypothetical protein